MTATDINSSTWYKGIASNVSCAASKTQVSFSNGWSFSGTQTFSKACVKVSNIQNYTKVSVTISSMSGGVGR